MDRSQFSAYEDSNQPVPAGLDTVQECGQGNTHLDQAFTVGVDLSEAWDGPNYDPRERIGPLRLLILALGTICICTAIGILTFLWANAMTAPNDLESGTTWRYIVFQGWATRVVTLCAAVIRMAMLSQAGLTSSMIASILLEDFEVQLWDVPLLSFVRSINVGPLHVIPNRLPNLFRLSSPVICDFALLLSRAITLASQLSSTLLLSDFANTAIVGDANKSAIAFTYPDDIPFSLGDSNGWLTLPDAYPRFAKYHEPPREWKEDRDDTGMTLRAFLPFRQTGERISIRDYRGPATVFDARVTCVRPTVTITSIIPFDDHELSSNTANNSLYILGIATLDPRSLPLDLPYNWRFNPDEGDHTFLCRVSNGFTYGFSYLSLCEVLSQATSRHGTFAIGTMVFNVTTPTSADDDIYGIWHGNREQVFDNQSVPWSMSNSKLWTTASLGASNHALISMTMCISFAPGLEYPVTLYSGKDGFEPSLVMDNMTQPIFDDSVPETTNRKPKVFDTKAIRYQMGATGEISSLEDRGLLALNYSATDWSQPINNEAPGPGYSMNIIDTLYTLHLNTTVLGFPDAINTLISTNPCSVMDFAWMTGDKIIINYGYVTLFKDILESTQSPALSLQALITNFNHVM